MTDMTAPQLPLPGGAQTEGTQTDAAEKSEMLAGHGRPMVIIGQPGDKRTGGVQRARAKLRLPPAAVVPYAALLEHGGLAAALRAVGHGALTRAEAPLLRAESPGSGFAAERALIALGAPDAPAWADGAPAEAGALHPLGARPDPQPLSAARAAALPELRGVLHHPSQWFRGYCRALARLKAEAAALWPQARWQNDPADIAAMTDKRRTQAILAAAGVPVPEPLGGIVPPDGYESLRALMLERRMHRVFIKLAFGSAASGVVAYQINPATGAELAQTTVGIERYITRPPVYYNAGKLRRYEDRETIAALINWLYRHGAYCERWIPKASWNGRAFDIRQLVVCGKACHSTARASRTPITNLHLRSQRVDPALTGLAPETLALAARTAERAAAAFPGSAVAGIDVLAAADGRSVYVADVNPFGDLLYDITHQGCDPYEWEMAALLEKGWL